MTVSTTSAGSILGRAVGAGVGAGAALGGVVGTFVFPAVLTFGGALVGAALGVVLGLVNGAALVAVVARTASRRVAAVTGAVISAVGTVAIVPTLNSLPLSRPALDLLLVPASAAIGAVLSPIAAFGIQLADGRPGQRPPADLIARIVVGGMIIGSALGAITGLVIGLFVYIPTAPFALIEGGLFGAGCGIVAALLVAFGLICVRLAARP